MRVVEEIKAKVEELLSEVEKVDNKSAMRRSRKRTSELEKLLKQFRKETLALEKATK